MVGGLRRAKMFSSVMVTEMVETVQRERMVEVARLSQQKEVAQAGRIHGHAERARMVVSALLQRMGRPRHGGSAPAGGNLPQWDFSALDRKQQSTGTMLIARF